MEAKKRYVTHSGKCCAVIGCKNSDKARYNFGISSCDIHNGRLHMYCGCDYPFRMFTFPNERSEESKANRLRWIYNLQRKDYRPHRNSLVGN